MSDPTWTNESKPGGLTWDDAIQTWASETSTWDELSGTAWTNVDHN